MCLELKEIRTMIWLSREVHMVQMHIGPMELILLVRRLTQLLVYQNH